MPERDDAPIHAYYRRHSELTDPREYAHLFDNLPSNLQGLVEVVQGLLAHLLWAKSYGLDIPAERRNEIYLRSVPEMLGRVLELDAAPFTVARPPERRLVGICRDFAVLLVSVLRHQGVPARLRVGFAGYFGGSRPKFWDHRIAEYWNGKCWVKVDPQVDEVQRSALNLHFDPLDLPEDAPFFAAGEVWRRCRAHAADPDDFGDAPDDFGFAPIRYALLHDLDALNKVELVGFDTWHGLIEKPEADLTKDEKRFLDEVARLTTQVDVRLAELRTLYETTPYGQAVRERLASERSLTFRSAR